MLLLRAFLRTLVPILYAALSFIVAAVVLVVVAAVFVVFGVTGEDADKYVSIFLLVFAGCAVVAVFVGTMREEYKRLKRDSTDV